MSDEKLKKLIQELDESVSKDNAIVKFNMYGGGPDESFVQANQKGYLRLGIEFLKAAFAPRLNTNKNDKIIDADIKYLTGNQTEISFDWLERNENIDPSIKAPAQCKFRDAASLIGCAIILFVLIFVFVSGVFEIIGWFKR